MSQPEKASLSPVQEEATPTETTETNDCPKCFESGTGRFLRHCNRPAGHDGECGPSASPDDQQNDGADELLTTCDINLPDGETQPVTATAQLDNGSGVTSAGGESGLPHRFRFTENIEVHDVGEAKLRAALSRIAQLETQLGEAIRERETPTAGPMTAPTGGFTLEAIWLAYAEGAKDARTTAERSGIEKITRELISSAADAYVKSVAVPLRQTEGK